MVESINTTSSGDELQNKILKFLHANNTIEDTSVYARQLDVAHTDLDKSLKSLLVDDYLVLTVIERKFIELTDEG
jgi:predicted transcriptional regulator